jgi:DNA polymerase/3'-5' exonuclease PolX
MSDKVKFPLALARGVARKIVEQLQPACQRIQIAGSVRRGKALVGDVEIVYVPRFVEVKNPESLFGDETVSVNAADAVIDQLIAGGCLAKRQNVLGRVAWGEENKLARAVKTGLPVDLFSTTAESWWNYMVCRTGSSETNMRIAKAAQAKHCQWCPTRAGFLQIFASGEHRMWIMKSEQEVFNFVGLPYLEPEER